MFLWLLVSAGSLLLVGLRLGADAVALGLAVGIAIATLIHGVMDGGSGPRLGVR